MQHKNKPTLILIYIVFTLSGFAGLIYESVWTHYLKLFLGHAAYSQALVLAIFMGGMALGAWLAGSLSKKLKAPLLAYACIELVIAFFGLIFHSTYVSVTDFAYTTIFTSISSPAGIQVIKWSLSAALILPQSILLGATFPIMSAGILRLFPSLPGKSLATLYFTNSIGAAIGILVAGFVLIDWIGLPGTILTAALLNAFVALVIWAVNKKQLEKPEFRIQADNATKMPISSLFLIVAFITGFSSFIYEIGWIRMLSLVLGSSSRAFELMLSAFIFGLAFGGLYIRKRIDTSINALKLLGWIQIGMGICAILTLWVYISSFDVMRYALAALKRSEEGYLLFNLTSHAIAFAVMLPATFLAGMTLPLITYILLKSGNGEKAIGNVYASNTLGAIIGVVVAALILMPLVGLKWMIIIGGLFDIVLGVGILAYNGNKRSKLVLPVFASVLTIAGVGLYVHFDQSTLSSGVYRHGRFLPTNTEIIYYQDGRTATISTMTGGKTVSISTNGKIDAGVSQTPAPSSDEYTMILTGALPLLHKPQAKNVAVIGMGSGISSHVVLSSPTVDSLETIEIEPAMIEGAKHFGKRNSNVYTDPRSKIVIEDAKAYFSAGNKQYDLIISEPSNPWVSGVSTLFSDEFYKHIKRHLKRDGLLAQWLQIYEIDAVAVSSIIKALSDNFSDYIIYGSLHDLIIIAAPNGKVPPISDMPLEAASFTKELSRIQAGNINRIQEFYYGDKELLGPVLESISTSANSDYFPELDQRATKTRFMSTTFTNLKDYPFSVFALNNIDASQKYGRHKRYSMEDSFIEIAKRSIRTRTAEMLSDLIAERKPQTSYNITGIARAEVYSHIAALKPNQNCTADYANTIWLSTVIDMASLLYTSYIYNELDDLWEKALTHRCAQLLKQDENDQLMLLHALTLGKYVELEKIASSWLQQDAKETDFSLRSQFYSALLFAFVAQKKYEDAYNTASNEVGFKSFPALALEKFAESKIMNANRH